LLNFLDAATSFIIGPPSQEFRMRRRRLPKSQGRINAQEGRKKSGVRAQSAVPPDKK